MKKQKLKHTQFKSPFHLLFKRWNGVFLFLLFVLSTPLIGQDQDLDPCSTIRADGILDSFQSIIVYNPVTDKQAIRIFDENWQKIDECTSSECGNPYNFATGPGRYFVQVQSFNEDGTWLCQADPIEVTVPAIITPCDALCDQQTLVEFESQADIDAFCGCEVIKGDVRITGNVTSLQPLNGLKKVEGFLAIFNTELTDFSGLESLEVLDADLVLSNNQKLEKLKGLENIENIKGALIIEGNPQLETLDGLNTKTAESLSLGENDALINIEALKNITTLGFVTITGNEKLPNLEGLNNLTNLGNGTTLGGGYTSLVIGGNASITTLSALSNLKTLDEKLVVQFNPSLTECCGITHLIDDDPSNGQVNSTIMIDNNLMGCNSVEDILANCQSPPPGCEAIALSINPNNASTIDIAGLTTPHYIVKVYDEDWNQILSCTDDCTSVGAYADGLYRIHVQLYDEDWQYICETDFLKITIGGAPEPVNCEDITTTISDLIIENGQTRREVSVTFNSPEGQRTGINIFDRSPEGTNGGGIIFDCGICESPQEFTLEEGEYVLIIDRSYLDVTINPIGCSETFFIDVPAEPCTDNDGDYICDYNECNDNDREVVDLKFPAGTPCNDEDDTTVDDVVQADGCTCMGTPISTNSCEDIALSINPNNANTIDIAGLTTPHYIVRVYDEDWNQILSCTDACTSVGAYDAGLYRIHAQLYDEDWQYICETEFLKITIDGAPERVNCEDITTTISDLMIENGQASRTVSVTFNTPDGQRTGINIFDRSPEGTNGGGILFDCGICENPQDFTLEEGEYVIIVDRSYLDVTINPLGCGETYFIDVPAEPCTDNDGDYLCDYNECNDNDREVVDLKFPAGTPCNDEDDTTRDDVIQADGCTCMGTPISDNPCDNVQVALFENDPRSIVVEGLNTGNQIVKVYDPHWNVIRDCSADCDLFGVFEDAGIYRVYAQLYDENWQYICETDFLEIEIPETESESRDGENFLNEKEIVLFPNPVLHTLNIKTKALQDKKGSIQIYNTFGQLVKEIPSKVFNQDYESIEVGNYENGLYIMTLKVENSPVISRRFLVENLK